VLKLLFTHCEHSDFFFPNLKVQRFQKFIFINFSILIDIQTVPKFLKLHVAHVFENKTQFTEVQDSILVVVNFSKDFLQSLSVIESDVFAKLFKAEFAIIVVVMSSENSFQILFAWSQSSGSQHLCHFFLFKAADLDGSGYLEMEEMAQMLTSAGLRPSKQDLETIFAAHDHNNDGKFSFEEFCKYVRFNDRKALKKIFGEIDHNQNGVLDFSELRLVFKNMSYMQFQEFWNSLDVNQDGKIDEDEFLKSLYF
jgi:Ca2+-binding EF-hand superfamily protein